MATRLQQNTRYREIFDAFIFGPYREYVEVTNSELLTIAENEVIVSFKYNVELIESGETFMLKVQFNNGEASISYSLENVDFDNFNEFSKRLEGIEGLKPSLNDYYKVVVRANTQN